MNRFYNQAIDSLRKLKQDENADDISDYVKHLEHEKNVLVNELSKADTFNGNVLLRTMGYNYD